jgi:hypothetical protein
MYVRVSKPAGGFILKREKTKKSREDLTLECSAATVGVFYYDIIVIFVFNDQQHFFIYYFLFVTNLGLIRRHILVQITLLFYQLFLYRR